DKRDPIAMAIGWTPRGSFLIAASFGGDGRTLDVWDPRTGAVRASVPIAPRSERPPPFSVSPDESAIAAIAQIEKLPDFSRCRPKPENGCLALRITSLKTGKAIATTMTALPDEAPPPVSFNADGSAVAAGGDVYDGRTGARLFAMGGQLARSPWTRDGTK